MPPVDHPRPLADHPRIRCGPPAGGLRGRFVHACSVSRDGCRLRPALFGSLCLGWATRAVFGKHPGLAFRFGPNDVVLASSIALSLLVNAPGGQGLRETPATSAEGKTHGTHLLSCGGDAAAAGCAQRSLAVLRSGKSARGCVSARARFQGAAVRLFASVEWNQRVAYSVTVSGSGRLHS